MPRGDGTGPMGIGPMTGRAAGRCAGNSMFGKMNQFPGGRGMGMGHGRGGRRGCGMGMGWRHGWASHADTTMAPPIPFTSHDEITVLKNQAKSYGEALESINSRINDLEMEKK